MQLGLPTGTIERSYGGFPVLPIVNLVSEKRITEPTQFALVSRPPLQKYQSSAWAGTYQIDALMYDDATASLYGIVNDTFYEDATGTTVALTVTTGITPSLASNEIGVVATGGTTAKWWDGSAFRTITFPDDADVRKVLQSQGRFIFLRSGSQKYYWTEPLSAMLDGSGDMTVDSLSYTSAESEDDVVLDGLIWQGRLVLGGTQTIEIHGVTGDTNSPWKPITGSAIHEGVLRTGAMAVFRGVPVWITPDNRILAYNGSPTPDRISNAGVEEILSGGTYTRLDSFVFEGREFLHVWDDGGSFSAITGDLLLDSTTNEWCEWETSGDVFDGGPSARVPDVAYPVFGAKTNSWILGMSSNDTLPGGSWEATPEHRFPAGLPIDGGSIEINNLLVRCDSQPPDVSSSATISMRMSRDKGKSWGDWKQISLQNTRTTWRSLGRIGQPGPLFQFKTANVDEFSVSGVMINEPVEGRVW